MSGTTGSARKRYAVVGLGGRSRLFIDAILGDYSSEAELVGFCDVNERRLDYHRKRVQAKFGVEAPTAFRSEAFEHMLAETRADTVIVTTIDRTHHDYILRAMEAGCDVITEKPMTTDVAKCRAILECVERTGRDLKVTFNYRYGPTRTKVKALLLDHSIGQVTSVHFEWLLNTQHGADYFRRWHRDKRNSGGLMVHKATHHFDLVNWWLDAAPETVFGIGKLAFYGRANAEARGEPRPYYRATGCPAAKGDPFALHLDDGGELQNLYLDAEQADGYLRDQNVFGDGISIEDTMSVMVGYRSGATLTYSLTAYAPWEGFRIAFNGTGGRLELEEVECSYVNAGGDSHQEGATASHQLRLCRHWEKPELIEVEEGEGGHGGGDVRLLKDLFAPDQQEDRYKRAAGADDGARTQEDSVRGERDHRSGRERTPVDERVHGDIGIPQRVGDPLRGVDPSSGGVHVQDDEQRSGLAGFTEAALDEGGQAELDHPGHGDPHDGTGRLSSERPTRPDPRGEQDTREHPPDASRR